MNWDRFHEWKEDFKMYLLGVHAALWLWFKGEKKRELTELEKRNRDYWLNYQEPKQ